MPPTDDEQQRHRAPWNIGQGIPPAPVDAPQPGAPSRFGLFSVARIIEDPPRHELNGVQYEPVCLVRADEWPLDCAIYPGPKGEKEERGTGRPFDGSRLVEPAPNPIGEDNGPSWPYGRKLAFHGKGVTTAYPFGVYAMEDCFLGNSDSRQALADLHERFTLAEEKTVERVIYDGLLGVTPALRYKPQILTAEGKEHDPISPIDGIGLLEHWLACTSGAEGVIHVPRFMAAMFGGAQEIRHQGPRAVSTLDHSYVFGAGYSGEAPFGDNGPVQETPGKVWLYASRPVTVRRSPIIQPADFAHGGFHLARNEASLLMERVYVVDWPCDVAAVQVDFPRYKLSTRPVDEDSDSPAHIDEQKQTGEPEPGAN